ncbi:Thaumatin-like protein 1 [Vitis vinifera]|uniref:Thaumatin-like protein 1 n=1 Tax=Vitis vinifera TaxID=29760 RepID=A0A438K5X8_VITVI|nr:Thaumatin-like protein 1 [Vitis vinifera]
MLTGPWQIGKVGLGPETENPCPCHPPASFQRSNVQPISLPIQDSEKKKTNIIFRHYLHKLFFFFYFNGSTSNSNPASPAPISLFRSVVGRTLCSADSAGKFTCITGDCGSGTLDCSGGGAAPPATLAEFTLNGANGLDFYDVSLVDGYNLPMLVAPQGGTGGNCTITGCVADLNAACPSELKVSSIEGGEGSESVSCKSACEAFGDAQYCCSGAYATPDTCKPSAYSEYFKSACPRAYSYAYDDGSSTFTCASADYTITFCPSPANSQKSSGGQYPQAVEVSAAAANRFTSFNSIIAVAVATVAAIWQWR